MKALQWLLGIALCAWIGQYALALLVPNALMELLYATAGARAGSNRLLVLPPADESARQVVRPSPDLLYAICLYDLADGPVVIEAQVPARYWSLQFYQMNTDNFAGVTNQRDEAHRVGSLIRLTLLGPGADPATVPGEVITSPTRRGVALLRASAIGDATPQREALQTSRCGPA